MDDTGFNAIGDVAVETKNTDFRGSDTLFRIFRLRPRGGPFVDSCGLICCWLAGFLGFWSSVLVVQSSFGVMCAASPVSGCQFPDQFFEVFVIFRAPAVRFGSQNCNLIGPVPPFLYPGRTSWHSG